MLIQPKPRHRSALRTLTVFAGTCIGFAAATLAQSGTDFGSESMRAPQTVSPALRHARELAETGRLVEAKAAVEKLVRAGGPDADRAMALALMRSIDARLRSADPVEVSLQRAELAVRDGDLLGAERWSGTVAGKAGVDRAQRDRAEAVLLEVRARRAEIQPLIPSLIDQASADFAAGRYGAAKASILAVLRSGVDLDAEVARNLENQQLQIVQLERDRGQNFEVSADAGFGMLDQPGTVRRPGQSQPVRPPEGTRSQDGGPPFSRDPAPAASWPTQPEAEPAPQPDEPLPVMPTDPAPAQPAAVEPPPPPPAAASSQDDIVRLAMRAEAQRLLTEADQAYDAARYAEASSRYDLALRQYRNYLDSPDISRAQDRLSDCRARLEVTRGGSAAQDVVGMTNLRRQQAQAEFDNEVAQATGSLEAGDPDRANDHAAKAGLAIRNARDLFTEGEYADFNARLDKLKIDIGARRQKLAEDERVRREAENAARAKRNEMERLNERDRKVNESIDRIRALQQERKYDEALAVVDQVLFLDPNNPTALLLKDILNDITIYRRFNEASTAKAEGYARLEVFNEMAIVPPKALVEFPTDWPSKTFQRGETSAFNEPRENRQVLAELASKKIPADFNEDKLESVLTYIQTLTQVPSDIDWESLEAIGIRKDTPISLKLTPLPVQTLLDRVLTKAAAGDQFRKAGWTVDRGVLVIGSQEELNKHKTLVIYNIQDLLFDVPDYDDVPEIDLNSVLQQSQGGGGGRSPFREQGGQDPERPTRQERIDQIKDIITQNVDREGWADNGGDVGAIQELNGQLIITNTPKNHREIVGLLSKIREIRNMQINVETKFLLVNTGWFEQVGFDLDVVINANNNQFRNVKATVPTAQPSDLFDFSGSRGTRPGLQRSTVPVDLNGDGDTTDAGEAGVGIINPAGWSPVSGQQNSFGLVNSLTQASVAEDSLANRVLSTAPALGIAGQFLDDIQVDFLIMATQADQRSVQLTAPRLTFTNGQTANIFVVTQQAFVSDLQPIVGDSAVGFDPTVSVASEGVTMLVEGVISADRRYVTMNVDAGVARIDGFGREAVTAVAGGQLVNSADTNSFIQLPTITVTRVRTTATVPDEGTVLLGGQRLITEVEVETGVPVLSKIPIINRFFTNRTESKEEQTLLILLKPTILIQSEQEEKNYPGLLDSVRTGIGGR